jgi:hypothetical protein
VQSLQALAIGATVGGEIDEATAQERVLLRQDAAGAQHRGRRRSQRFFSGDVLNAPRHDRNRHLAGSALAERATQSEQKVEAELERLPLAGASRLAVGAEAPKMNPALKNRALRGQLVDQSGEVLGTAGVDGELVGPSRANPLAGSTVTIA